MEFRFSKAASSVSLSPTARVLDRAAAKRAEGAVLHDFGIGEPRNNTPEGIRDAGVRAIREGITRYTGNEGTPALRRAVAGYLKRSRGLEFRPEEILISNGAKQSVYNAVAALCGPGAEVLIPLPAYPSYAEMVRLCSAEPVYMQPDEDSLKITPEGLEEAVTAKTGLFIFNQPSNPTGRAYSREELKALGKVLLRHDIPVITDEIYSDTMVPGEVFTSLLAAVPELKDRCIIVSGASKSFAMTGWRIGFAAGPAEIISVMNTVQNHSSGHPSSISQFAAEEAFSRAEYYASEICDSLSIRRELCRKELERIPGIRWSEPEGAFYFFCDVRSYLPSLGILGETLSNTLDLSLYLLENYNIVCVSGEAFGFAGYLRLSCTAPEPDLEDGMKAFSRAIGDLKKR